MYVFIPESNDFDMAIATNSYRPTLKGIKKEPTVKERSRNNRHLRISVKNNEYLLEQLRLPIS